MCKTISTLSLCICILSNCFSPTLSNALENTPQNNILITISLDNQKFQDVAKVVSEKLGYEILVDENLMPIMTTGTFTDVNVEYFLRHILRGQNLVITTDTDAKKIVIRSFGEKSNLVAIGHTNKKISDLTDPISGKKYSERKRLYDKSVQEHNENRMNPETIDPISGKSYVEQRNSFARNLNNSMNNKLDSGAIDPISGKSYAELQTDRQTNFQKSDAMKSNSGTIDPISGKSYIEKDNAFKKNLQTSMEKRLDSGTIDPITGKSYVELRRIREEAFQAISQ